MPDQEPRGIPAQRVRPIGEEAVERRHVVRHEGRLVGEHRIHEPIRFGDSVGQVHRRAHMRATHAKSAFRMRACTPHTRSTTCDTSKSVAAER